MISELQALSKRLSVESSHNCKVSLTEGYEGGNAFHRATTLSPFALHIGLVPGVTLIW